MRDNIGLIVIIIIAVVGISLFAFFNSHKDEVKNISVDNIEETLKDVDLAVVYFGDLTSEKEELVREVIKDTSIQLFTSKATVDELNSILIVNTITVEDNDIYVLFINGDPLGIVNGNASAKILRDTFNEVFFDEIPQDKIAYVVPDVDEYIKKVKSKKYTVTVFAIDDCIYCTKYLPVINNIARNYGVEVNYIHRSTYDEEGYKKIMALDLKIPAKCTMNNEDTTMLAGFPKPMTIITKDGKLVDCIKGNVSEQTVLDTFAKYGLVKENE